MTEQETKIAELEELNLLLNKENEMLKKKIAEQTQSACAGVMPKIMELIDKVIEIHPYKRVGNLDTYDIYNEGWEDGLDRLKTEIENNFSA